MKTKKKMTVGRAALYIIVYIAALFWIFPVIWMLVSSLKPYGTLSLIHISEPTRH